MQVFPFNVQDEEYASLMKKIGVSAAGTAIMRGRFSIKTFMVSDISTPAANVVKQEVLSLGGEAAVPAHAVNCSNPKSDFVFSLRSDKISEFAARMKAQCWKLPQVADFIEKFVGSQKPWFSFSHPGIDTTRPNIMGILNVTPDSFSDGGSWTDIDAALKHVSEMVENGADIIDVGGESTRPGSDPVDAETEKKRVVPVISEIKKQFPKAVISIDTVKSSVAEAAVNAGAEIINDVSGLTFDPEMASVCAGAGKPVVIGHIKGSPKDMQENPVYGNLFGEMLDFFNRSKEMLLSKGLSESKIIIDPGIGFGKTLEHNLAIIKHLEVFFSCLDPVAVGFSRKSVIGAICGRKNPLERLAGTVALDTIALEKGAAVIRVHDVKEAKDTLEIFNALKEPSCL
ncbi:dihydropteroate synthase [bacterium]|nr:dihydropteroate synthase [bacterium]